MRFLILGPLVVLGDGEEVSLGGIKPRAVLAVLLLHANEPVSAERLARSLWGEDAPEGATRTVQVHVSRLRKALGNADIVETTPAGYRLRVGADELDAAQFERLVEEGRHALDGGQPERAATILRDALELWRGPALADLAFEPFAAAHVSRLEEQRLAALEVRLEADLASGGHTELVDELQRLVVVHPTRERFVAQLMLALYRCGRQADALEAYQDARRVLLAAIGIEPGPQLRDVQRAILRQDVALEADGGVPELPPELDTATAPPLVGRDDELAWLRLRWERAREGSGALVVIAGERGAGKTRLAAELAGDAHRRGDAVLHVTGRGSSKPAIDVLRGLPNVARRTLLVVDDADAGGAPDVLEALAASTRALASAQLLVVVCCEDPDALARMRFDGVLALEPLDAEGVRSIGRHYASAKAPAEVPAEWLLEASGGVPRRVHEVASQWARREAAQRVTAVAERAETDRAHLRTSQDELASNVLELQEAGERFGRRHDEAPVVCPYKGLASYDVGDARYFCGREQLVAEIVARLVGAPLIGIVGPSGSGKSSVMRAGLLPALRNGVLPGSADWAQVLVRPGAHPVRELAAGLAKLDEGDRRVVLAIDQFEETFTVCADETERRDFIAELVHAAQDRDRGYVVLIALRADYYGRCAAYPELAALIAANNVLVRSMAPDELRRAVERPARRAGLRIEPELVDAIVTDVEREPGGLPLMSTALLELWQHRDGRRLRHSDYARSGGVHGAVARLAENAFGQLDEAQQAIARGVLMRLVGTDDEGAVERRRVALSELELDRDEAVARVVGVLTDRRLLTVSAGSVEVAHEALLREWPRLRGWIEEDRNGLRIQGALIAALREWERLDRNDGALLRGSRLTEALEWRDAKRPALNEPERELLAASEAARDRELVTRQRRTRLVLGAVATIVAAGAAVAVAVVFTHREHAITASRDLATQSAATLDVDPGLAFALARKALERRDTAQAQDAVRQATLGYRLTAAAQASKRRLYMPDPSPAGRSVTTSGADGAVRVWRLGRHLIGRTLVTYPLDALSSAFVPGNKLVASVSYDGQIAMTPLAGGPTRTIARLGGKDKDFGYRVDAAPSMLVVGTYAGTVWMIPTGHGERRYVLGRHKGKRIYVVGFNPDATKVVSGGEGSVADIWDVASRSAISLPHPDAVYDATFSPDGRTVATACEDGRVRLWDASSGKLKRALPIDDKPIWSVRFSADGLRIVTAGEAGVARITDVRNGQLISELGGGSGNDADFVPHSDAIVTTGDDGSLRTWVPLAVQRPRATGTTPSFSSDGRLVVSGGAHGEVHLWDLRDGERRLPGHSKASVARVSSDGQQIVSASLDGSVRLYDVASRRSRQLPFPKRVAPSGRLSAKRAVAISRAGRIAIGGDGEVIVVQDASGANAVKLPYKTPVNALSFSPDGTQLASASDDGTARVWDLRTRRAHVIETDKLPVNWVSFSDDNRRLATAGADGTVRVWHLDGGPPVVLTGHATSVNTAEFNHRGDRVVSAGDDGTVRIWDAAGGDTLVVLHRHVGSASGAAFSPDGSSVVSAGRDGIRVTPCEVCGSFADVLRIADTRAPRPLSASERQRLDRGG